MNVRLSAEERDAIKSRSRSAGLTMSDYIRKCALQSTNRPVIRTDAETLRKVYADLRKQGGLLNQIARELNTHHQPDQLETELSVALKSVSHAAEETARFLADARSSL